MIDISRRLLFYKREDVRRAIAESCVDREVAVKFATYFGKRPDSIQYPEEILDLIKKGATSFHISEEHWENPLNLSTGSSKRELDELRKGWDLVLDIDCPNWEFSKLTAYLFIQALKRHTISSVSCKFSGNKGFHIGVPFKAFPERHGRTYVKDMFPEGPQRIAKYLLDYISSKMVVQSGQEIIFDGKYRYTISQLSSDLNIDKDKLSYKSRCVRCKTFLETDKLTEYEYVCSRCEHRTISRQKRDPVCEKCHSIAEEYIHKRTKCQKCGGTEFEDSFTFNPFSVVEIDTVLIAPRHLFRSAYSMNEKSGLVSIVIDPDRVMDFEKDEARPENVVVGDLRFLDDRTTRPMEGAYLFTKAMESTADIKDGEEGTASGQKKYDIPIEAVPQTLFPPCIVKILEGLKDGKKRSLFVLLNFLTSVGWDYPAIEGLLDDWNKRNQEPLRDVLLKGQTRYHKLKKEKIPPPNCRRYYQDMGVCLPDGLCEKIRNPVNYSLRKARLTGGGKAARPKLTEEQKAMRREYRKKLKENKKEGKVASDEVHTQGA